MMHPSPRLPDWLRVRLAPDRTGRGVARLVKAKQLNTVCQSAACPNRTECWNSGTATFMILGNICTRGCRFCNVKKGAPSERDTEEPIRVADAVRQLGIDYAVITSVTRDDLLDGGASVFADTIREIKKVSPGCRVEVLVPDFGGSHDALSAVIAASPDVLNHNIETVPSLYPLVRPGADYRRSLELLRTAKDAGVVTKSGLMLGLGEGINDIRQAMKDLLHVGCDILTLGQYLRPSKQHLPVARYYHPDDFSALKEEALAMGFRSVAAGPLIRSSYRAHEALIS